MPRRRINRGLIVRLSGLLLLGAMLTIIAAWAPAVWWYSQPTSWVATPRPPTDEQSRWWSSTISLPRYPRPTAALRPDAMSIGFDHEDMYTSDAAATVSAYRWRSGLPMRSMMHYRWSISPGSAGALADSYESRKWNTNFALVRHRRPIVLPVVPIWPGFVVDTLFFAALSAVILAGWRCMVRRWRVRRGLCPTCAYPVGTSPVCTECGGALAGRATR